MMLLDAVMLPAAPATWASLCPCMGRLHTPVVKTEGQAHAPVTRPGRRLHREGAPAVWGIVGYTRWSVLSRGG